MRKEKTVYEVQENTGKRWQAVTYEIYTINEAISIRDDYQKNTPDVNFRVIKRKIIETIIE